MPEIDNTLKHDLLDVSDPQEKEYRQKILEEIEERVAANGPHRARPDSTRARQFMPFAALKGYSEMVQQTEESTGDK